MSDETMPKAQQHGSDELGWAMDWLVKFVAEDGQRSRPHASAVRRAHAGLLRERARAAELETEAAARLNEGRHEKLRMQAGGCHDRCPFLRMNFKDEWCGHPKGPRGQKRFYLPSGNSVPDWCPRIGLETVVPALDADVATKVDVP